MPSTGFYLFLHDNSNLKYQDMYCVNALNGLLLISSDTTMAFELANKKGVNALNGLLLISSISLRESQDSGLCVNALNGLLLISSYMTLEERDRYMKVSMPSTGFYLFLQR